MEVEEIQTPACKFARVGNNGRNDSSNKIGQKGGGGGGAGLEQYPADDEEDGGGGGGIKRIAFGGGDSRLRGWHHQSSRIYRVSRASGGKDRHSKVVTSKGLRDRRVRLSVSTAIAFYDLQDRLGYDQPSKAVEWLIKAAAEAIAELPSLNSPFSDTTLKQLSDGKRGTAGIDQGLIDSADVELDDGDPNYQHQHQQQQQQQLSLSKSACSSTSETSKGSGLSLSRPDVRVNRVKARERARERAAKEKEKEHEALIAGHQQQNVNNPISQNSFTELLNAGLSSVSNNTSSTTASGHQSPAGGGGGEPDLFHKQPARHHQQWSNSTSMSDYFATGFLGGGGASSSRTNHHSSGGFLGQIQLGNSLPQSIAVVPPFSLGGDSNNDNNHHHHQELQHYSFLPDHLTTQPGGGNDYNLNFTISSSSLAGFNRGTLQSNSVQPSGLSHHHLQRFSPIDGSNNLLFFTGTATAAPPPPSAASAPLENHHNHHFHHQFAPGFDGRSLQLYHGDGSRHSDQKGKEKN